MLYSLSTISPLCEPSPAFFSLGASSLVTCSQAAHNRNPAEDKEENASYQKSPMLHSTATGHSFVHAVVISPRSSSFPSWPPGYGRREGLGGVIGLASQGDHATKDRLPGEGPPARREAIAAGDAILFTYTLYHHHQSWREEREAGG